MALGQKLAVKRTDEEQDFTEFTEAGRNTDVGSFGGKYCCRRKWTQTTLGEKNFLINAVT